jgi:hypothetical protein
MWSFSNSLKSGAISFMIAVMRSNCTYILILLILLGGTVRARANVSAADVIVANSLKGAISQYNVSFTTTVDLSRNTDDIVVTFPSGTNPNSIKKKDVKVNGDGVKDLTTSGQTLTIRLKKDVDAGSVTVQFRDPPGVTNPLTAGSYTVDVSTTTEPVIVTSNSYTITSTAVLTSATVTPTSSVAGNASGYKLQFSLGGSGALAAAVGIFSIVLPTDTVVPEGLIYGTTVQGTPATSIGVSATRTIQVETPVTLASLTDVTIIMAASTGIVNPTTAATYTLTLATSAETTPITSNAFTFFDGTSLSPASVDIDPNTVNTASEYTVSARLGVGGGLTGGVDHIFLDFADDTIVPASIATGDVLVDNGTYAVNPTSVTPVPGSSQITVVPSQDIADGAAATVIIKTEAGVINPILTGNYTLDMATSQEDTVTSNSYLTFQAITNVTPATVTLSNSDKKKLSNTL